MNPGRRCLLELKDKKFLLGHPTPSYFTTAEWKWPPIIYVLYRVVIALYFTAWLVLSGIIGRDKGYWFIYASNWIFLVLTITANIMAVTTVHDYVRNRTAISGCAEPPKMPLYLKLQWVLYNLSTPASLAITLAYWIVRWDPLLGTNLVGLHMHGINTLYIAVDLFITAMPVRILHVWHLLSFWTVYVIFNLIYCGVGGKDPHGNSYIYSTMDFYSERFVLAVYAAGGILILGLPMIWLFVFGLQFVRVYLSNRWWRCGRDYGKVQPEEVATSAESRTVTEVAAAEETRGAASPRHQGAIFTVE